MGLLNNYRSVLKRKRGETLMKEHVLVKKNVFTCIMFGAIFLFVLVESIFELEALSIIAFIIAVPLFFLSIIQLIINVLERINDKITSFLSGIEDQDIPTYDDLDRIRDSNKSTINDVIQDICQEYPDNEYICDDLNHYFNARKTRSSIRTARRVMLYIYYSLCMVILLLLLLHTEVYAFFKNTEQNISINTDSFEVWSLVIILFEIMMKDIVEDIIICIISKKMSIHLEYY